METYEVMSVWLCIRSRRMVASHSSQLNSVDCKRTSAQMILTFGIPCISINMYSFIKPTEYIMSYIHIIVQIHSDMFWAKMCPPSGNSCKEFETAYS